MNRDFTFGPDRTISLAESEEGEYRIIVSRRPETGLEVFLEVPGADERSDSSAKHRMTKAERDSRPDTSDGIDTVVGHRCGRFTRTGNPCLARVASVGQACYRHRQDQATS